MDRTGSPDLLWLLCMIYVVFILNRLSHKTLGGKTPIEASLGYTPDISVLLCFYWYQPVLYLEYETSFPNSKEKLGHFVGVSENVLNNLYSS